MGKTKFNRYRGVRKRRKIKSNPVLNAARDLLSSARARPTKENDEDEPLSTSAKKLEYFQLTLDDMIERVNQKTTHSIGNDCFLLVQTVSLNKLIANLCCQHCKQTGVVFSTHNDKHKGFCAKGYVYCQKCQLVIAEEYLSERAGEAANESFEINVRAVFAFMGIGCGFNAIKDWSSVINLPNCLSKFAYQGIKEKLIKGSKETFDEVSKQSMAIIRQKYAEIGIFPDKDNILDVAVSFDGTWQKRGHSSHNGAAIVIEILTGLPVDYEVLSNFCHQCLKAPSRDDVMYGQWQAKHALKCSKNYEGSANSMEQECARLMWKRSVEKHGLRYTTMLSDGDSKSFALLSELNVYGADIQIMKEECVNHVSKRMGTSLNKLVQDCKAQKQPITGKGKLTKEKILKIQSYYGRAIKDNVNDTLLMKKRIFAILFHLTSTDTNPKHQHCPPGEKSWCFWNREEAKGKIPGPHKEHERIPVDIGRKLVPIFQRLSEDSLLQRCKRGASQNQNESLHSVIWRFCPKLNYAGRRSIEAAICMALCQFLKGSMFRETLMKFLAINPGHYLIKGSLEKSIERVKKANLSSSKEAKKRRKQLKYSKSSKEKMQVAEEGATYQSGSFD